MKDINLWNRGAPKKLSHGPSMCCLKEILFTCNDINSLEIKGMPCVLGFSRETKQEGGR